MRLLTVFLLCFLLLPMTNALAHDYKEGQVWSYRTRPGEEGSTLLINKIESNPTLGRIFHISVFAVRVKNKRSPGVPITEMPHFPVSQQTLDSSVTKLLGEAPPNPDYLEGYTEWKRVFDQGKAGIFTIPVSEIVEVVETSINQ